MNDEYRDDFAEAKPIADQVRDAHASLRALLGDYGRTPTVQAEGADAAGQGASAMEKVKAWLYELAAEDANRVPEEQILPQVLERKALSGQTLSAVANQMLFIEKRNAQKENRDVDPALAEVAGLLRNPENPVPESPELSFAGQEKPPQGSIAAVLRTRQLGPFSKS